MNGSQKAAALLVQLGTTRAAKVLRNMTEVEVIELMTQVAALPQLDDDTVDSVVQDFSLGLAATRSISQGGMEQARALLTERLGARQAESVLEQLGAGLAGNPLKFLDSVDPQQIAAFVGDEHPQLVAVIVAHLPLDSAAAVLGEFDAARGADIAARVANMGRISPDVLNQTGDLVRRKLAALLSNEQAFATGGVDALVGILNHSDRATEKRIIGDLELQDPALAERVRAQLFVFDDIGGIDDRTMQRILRNVVPGRPRRRPQDRVGRRAQQVPGQHVRARGRRRAGRDGHHGPGTGLHRRGRTDRHRPRHPRARGGRRGHSVEGEQR